ncbi:MAG: MBL fold metallo-hydrolase [Bacteroidales bacterium]|nr:MBL fold metallo-hydrolase [Bacteroidales bacterium]
MILYKLKKYWLIHCILIVILTGCSKEDKIIITFYGGAEEIGGSCTKLEYDNYNILVDIGSYIYEEYDESGDNNCLAKKELYKKNQILLFDPQEINSVVITHSHTDHCGRLIQLCKNGFSGNIYMTELSAKLSVILLRNIIRYDEEPRQWVFNKKALNMPYINAHWRMCNYVRRLKYPYYFNGSFCEMKNRFNKKIFPCKHCAQLELVPILEKYKIVNYFDSFKLNKNISFTLIPIYHLPGSSSVIFNIKKDKSIKKIIFSGDIGNDIKLLYNYYKPYPKADVIIIEGTYGDKERKRNYDYLIQEFIDDVAKALKQNKIVWIPAFALDRTQKLLYVLNKAKLEGYIPYHIPIYVPSPSATQFNNIYVKYAYSDDFISSDIVKYLPYYNYKMPEYNDLRGPCILITTSGMMNTSYSEELLPILLPRNDVFLCFVGFQSKNTPGWKILQNKQKIYYNKQYIPVNLTWEKYEFFSGHGDFIDVIYLLSNNKNSTIILNHGDKKTLKKMKNKLENYGFSNVIIAKKNKEYTF